MDPGLRRDDAGVCGEAAQPQLPLLAATTLFTWLSV